jgi:hypothetical protein
MNLSIEWPSDEEVFSRLEDAKRSGLVPALSYERISDAVQEGGISKAYQNERAIRYAQDASRG